MTEFQICRSYEGTRIRLQRLSDSRFFTGWLVDVHAEAIILRINGPEVPESNDEFFIQAYGDKTSAMFRAVYDARLGARSRFRITSKPQIVESEESVRVLVRDLTCKVKIGWFETAADVLDISENGIGLKMQTSIDRAEVLNVSMITHFGEIGGKGEVCYSRPIDGLPGEYRIGVEMYPMDRLNQAKWNRMVKSAMTEADAA